MWRCVWALTEADIAEHVSMSVEPMTKQWLFSMIETMKKEDQVRMLVTLCAIWHARRKVTHEDLFQSPMSTVIFVEKFLSNLEACSVSSEVGQGKRPARKAKGGCIEPMAGRTNMNVDAAVAKSDVKGSVGVVCRSREGVYLRASAVVFEGLANPACLEALACREALDLAADLNIGPTQVATDCLEVIKGLQGKYLGVFSNVLHE
jgi:hypothetical protein